MPIENKRNEGKLYGKIRIMPEVRTEFHRRGRAGILRRVFEGNAGRKTFADDLEEVEETEEMELCPICGENYMRIGEKMCDECKKKTEYEEEEIEDPDKDDAWRTYLDDDADDLGIPLPEEEFDDEDEEDDLEEDEEGKSKEEDDFEYVSPDDYYPDDEEEDEDDEEDPFDDDEAPSPKTGKKKRVRDDDF